MVKVCFHAFCGTISMCCPPHTHTNHNTHAAMRKMHVARLGSIRSSSGSYALCVCSFYFLFYLSYWSIIDLPNFIISVQRKNVSVLVFWCSNLWYGMFFSNLPESGFQRFHLKYHRIDKTAASVAWFLTRTQTKTGEPVRGVVWWCVLGYDCSVLFAVFTVHLLSQAPRY